MSVDRLRATRPAPAPEAIAIIGGGPSGAAVAYHLAASGIEAPILIFEPRRLLGGGLAYDTDELPFRINVPASKMSLLPDDETHFLRWIAKTGAVDDDPDALELDGQIFPRRRIFGRYVAEQVAPFLANGRIVHVDVAVASIVPDGGGWIIETSDHRRYGAGCVVLATTHPPPAVPSILDRALGSDRRLIRDPLQPGIFDRIAATADVLIVGTGLTMADSVAALAARGHQGKITAISRRGLISSAHAEKASDPYGDFVGESQPTAVNLLRHIRRTIAEARDEGISWHAVIDAVRAQAQTFWPRLPLAEKKRLVRHLRPYWDVHRFRLPPRIERTLEDKRRDGSLEVFAASLVDAAAKPDSIDVTLKRRRGPVITLACDAIIVTTGPAHDRVIATSPHFASLEAAGAIRADSVGLGIACDERGRALDASGLPIATLFIAGPLARGTFGELMGLPQVTEYAKRIAAAVGDVWRLHVAGEAADSGAT